MGHDLESICSGPAPQCRAEPSPPRASASAGEDPDTNGEVASGQRRASERTKWCGQGGLGGAAQWAYRTQWTPGDHDGRVGMGMGGDQGMDMTWTWLGAGGSREWWWW